MANLTLQTINQSGLAATFAAAAVGGDEFVNDGRTVLRVVNGSGAPITVTVDSKVACNQGSDHDAVVSVAAGATVDIGPFEPSRFNGADNRADVSYSGVTSLTVAAIKLASL